MLLVIFQVVGAWIAADILYVSLATAGNAILQRLLRWRPIPLRIYMAAIGIIFWAVAMRAGYGCSVDDSWQSLVECVRHPGRGVSAACMATACVLVLSATVTKDRLSRTLLELGISRRLLWVIFIVPTLGHTLLDTTGRSASLMRGRYLQNAGRTRWIRLKIAILTSGFVKTLIRHWYSREAEETRNRETAQAPLFLDSDRILARDGVLLTWAALSLVFALIS